MAALADRPMIPADDEAAILAAAARIAARRRRTEARSCAYCGRPLVGTTRRRYCSDTCRSAAWQKTHRERVNASRRRRCQRQHAGTDAPADPGHGADPPTATPPS